MLSPRSDYVHLHVHSDASLKDGLTPVWELVAAAKNSGFKSLAITDHGSLANAIAFTIECKSAGIKPILGLEAYVAVDGEIGHMTVLADGNEGFENLIRLDNLGHASSFRQPAFTIDQLIEHNAGLILLSGCVSSPLNRMSYKDALHLQARLMNAFGPRFFQEVMFIADVDTWSRPLKLAADTNTRLVLTNDVHFPLRQDAKIHPILTSMKAGFNYDSNELWLKPGGDVIDRALSFGIPRDIIVDAAKRTAKIAMLTHEVTFDSTPRLPHIDGANELLRSKAFAGLERIGRRSDERYVKRLEYELDIITKMNYATYFLILDDIIGFANSKNIRVGPGRGSGASSLVLYVLGITQIDPIEFNLSFERFLNPERKGMPDVDTDFESERRNEIIEYATTKWHASPIATYVRYSHKVLVHDLAKQLRLPRAVEKLAAENGDDSDEFKALCESSTDFEYAYRRIIGQIRHKGKHAGGVIVTDRSVPLERTGDALAASWTEGRHNELSYIGVVKFDLLGISALSALRRLETKVGRRAEDPEDDSPVFSLFREGDLSGIFQFSGSGGIKKLTMRIQPRTFEDLIVINALYRPGALDVGATDAFPEWKLSPRRIHPSVDDILAPTYGAIVYQEQVMEIYARLTGGTLGQADTARRIIVKSKQDDPEWVKQMEALQYEFIAGAIAHGFTQEQADEFWHELAAHSRYSFNRSHAVAYARISWELAWFKYYYPANFYAEMLNTDKENAQTYIIDAVSRGIDVIPPHVNVSTSDYEVLDNKIFMPLTSIKYLSDTGAEAIVSARHAKPFESLGDFMARVPKKLVRAPAREGLLATGAFDGLPGYISSLGLKRIEAEPLEKDTELMTKYLGVVVPSKEILRTIESKSIDDTLCGIVSSKRKKESHYGPYTVYYLAPNGTFWYRGPQEFEIGSLIEVKVNESNGKALKVRRL